MAIFTRDELRGGVYAPANFTVDTYNFTLDNNAGNSYFAIESKNGESIFNKASIINNVNCSFVTGSKNAAFSVNGNSSPTFGLVINEEIAKEDIKFTATNSLVYSLGDPTSSGSIMGIEVNYS